ncbi:MAG: isocitrate lyase/phosphoenolpyruvate mutase family protein [Prolixibacteraceae bacterium]|nr:isocitrate lyase/phosphoenolpyruvate mutase family protein [Burkholderiales bacterium]
MISQTQKGEKFAGSHVDPGIVILPNAWDAGSAIMMAEAGFPAIATTSAGVAFALGLPDGQRVSRDRMLECVAQIVAAVPVPVTADLEAGYGFRPEDVAATVRGALETGAVGCNIEDATGRADQPLFDLELACDRIRAAAEAARGADSPFVLNARTDPYLVRHGSDSANFAEAVKRANAYREAGADCLFVPGPMDADTIARLVREINGPLNVLGARGGSASTLSVAELGRLGVKRVSIGGSMAVAALAFVQRALFELRERGTFSYAPPALSNATTNAIMARHRG